MHILPFYIERVLLLKIKDDLIVFKFISELEPEKLGKSLKLNIYFSCASAMCPDF